jgi:hypothetical protein
MYEWKEILRILRIYINLNESFLKYLEIQFKQ